MAKKRSCRRTEKQKEIINELYKFKSGINLYQVFDDWVELMAYAFSNAINFMQSREDAYIAIMNKYIAEDRKRFIYMMNLLVLAMDEGFDDNLGTIYMGIENGNKHAGQFFTPYHVCKLMSALTNPEEGAVVNEPSCGAGANVIAFLERCKSKGIDYQRKVEIYAQDIDFRCVCMCYVQLYLYGARATVARVDTLRDLPPEEDAVFVTFAKAGGIV